MINLSVLRNELVSIVKCREYRNYPEILIAVRKAVAMLGGLNSIVSPGDIVLIKPNLVWDIPWETGGITNPYVIKAVAELSLAAGAAKIVIADGAGVGSNASSAWENQGYHDIVDLKQCEFFDFAEGEFQMVTNPGAFVFKKIRLPKLYLEANVVINLPVMKTHDALRLTLGIKNMKGLIHISDKKRFHKWGLAQSVVDLNKIVLPELTILDGTIGMEGNGPVAGDPVGLGLILASTDTVACDRVAAEIMGFTEDEIGYIKMAGEQGLGCFDLSKIRVIGENLADVKSPFKRLDFNEAILNELGIRLIPCNACSGCSTVMKSYLKFRENFEAMDDLRDVTFIYGQTPKIPENTPGRIVRVGTCTRNLDCKGSLYVPGCPPHPAHFDDILTNK